MGRQILLHIGIVLTAALLSVGCTQDLTETPSPDGKPGKKVVVALQLRIPKTVNPTPVPKLSSALASTSRADNARQPFQLEFEEPQVTSQTRSDGTTKLYNLWLFQFNADGGINGLPQKISDEATAINDMVLIDVPLVVATNQTLYLIALGRQIDENPSTIRTFSDLENFSFGYTTSKGGIARSKVTSEDDMPFAGYIKGATVVEVPTGENRGQIEYNTPDGFTGGIDIRRLMAKVTLRYKFEVPDYKLQGLRLMNANATVRITNPDKNDDTDTYFPLEGEMSADTDADGFYSVTWFMAQNQQGNVDEILTESDRYYYVENKTVFGKAPVLGTNIEAWAYSVSSPDSYAIYQMYLGKNSPSNFDVTHNTYYNIRTTINTDVGSAKNDGRVRPYNAQLKTYLLASNYSYGSDDTDTDRGDIAHERYDFDAHYDTRQIDIYTKGRIVKIGIYEDRECTKLADPATSWLKISSSKNYTEAYNNAAEPLSTSISTDVIQLPTKLTFYLYNDEYLVDKDGNYFDYTQASSAKRSLYVWVLTTTEGVTESKIKRNSKVYWFDQRPAVYAGRAGGKLENMKYERGLCSEQIMEANICYTQEIYPGQNSLAVGYYNQAIETKTNYDGVGDAWNGYLATRQQVYNPDKLTVNLKYGGSATDNYKNPVIRPDGHPMLYQYYHKISYAARSCFDKNRDNNGNGYLEDNEVVWYLPAVYQTYSTRLWMYDLQSVNNNISSMLSSTIFKNFGTTIDLSYDGAQIFTSGGSIRCVREYQPANQTNEQMYIYKDARNNEYGAINASALPKSEDRSLDANPDIYETLPLYTYTPDGTTSVPILDGDGNKIYVKRLRRHYPKAAAAGKASINLGVSANFLIAPTDINADGKPVKDPLVDKNEPLMDWATAMGYVATANTQAPEIGLKPEGSSAVPKGCPMYQGKDGLDPIGSWRVPTVAESMLIGIYYNEYNKICTTIGSKPITLPTSDGGYGAGAYWLATEYSATDAWKIVLFNKKVVRPDLRGGSGGTNQKTNINTISYHHPVRCIRDLPPRP